MVNLALQYFLSAHRDVVALDCIELWHPSFSRLYRLVRNARDGVTVTLETGESAWFEWYPMRITEKRDALDLDQGFQIDFGDLGETIPRELDLIQTANTMRTKPSLNYRVYRSDNLSSPIIGPYKLEVRSFSFNKQGASFEASAPFLNLNKTGENYNLTRFFTLRGFVK